MSLELAIFTLNEKTKVGELDIEIAPSLLEQKGLF